jgi:hypothetical protein
MIISQIFCQNYVSCVVVCVYDCVRLLFWCVFYSHMYILPNSCVYSAKPPSENEERKFKKKRKIITKSIKLKKFSILNSF